jgi:hypothetical protein
MSVEKYNHGDTEWEKDDLDEESEFPDGIYPPNDLLT